MEHILNPRWSHRFRRPWILWCNQIFAGHLFNEKKLQNNVVIYYLVRQQFKKCICIILYFFSLFKSRNRKVLVRNSKLQCLDYAMVHLAIRFLFIFIFVEIAWCWHTIFKTNFLESRYLAVYGKKEKKSLRVIFIFIANYRLFNLWNW